MRSPFTVRCSPFGLDGASSYVSLSDKQNHGGPLHRACITPTRRHDSPAGSDGASPHRSSFSDRQNHGDCPFHRACIAPTRRTADTIPLVSPEPAGQPDLLDLDLLVQDFTGGGIHALHTSFASSGDAEFDRRIQEMVNDWGVRESHELIAEMIVTALRMGSDSVPVPDLKLINRSLKELRQAAKVFAPYQGIRKIAIFGSARTSPHVEVYQAAERFARLMREHGYMIITGGGDGIMGAAQRGAGRANSFGLNIRLPFEQKANETIDGDPKLVNFNYFFTRKVNFIKETHAIALFPGGFGTMDEGFECLTLMQTGKARIIPVILIDKIGGTYWKSWTEFLRGHLLGQGLISPDDFSLFTITEDVEEAVRMVLQFYRNFHSYRWVGQDLVIRLHRQLTPDAVEGLNKSFSDLFESAPLRTSRALKPERNEPELSNMPRLVVGSHRRNFGRLRQLLDAINEADTIGNKA